MILGGFLMMRTTKIVRQLVPTSVAALAPGANDNITQRRAGLRYAAAFLPLRGLRWASIVSGALYIGCLRTSIRIARWTQGGSR